MFQSYHSIAFPRLVPTSARRRSLPPMVRLGIACARAPIAPPLRRMLIVYDEQVIDGCQARRWERPGSGRWKIGQEDGGGRDRTSKFSRCVSLDGLDDCPLARSRAATRPSTWSAPGTRDGAPPPAPREIEAPEAVGVRTRRPRTSPRSGRGSPPCP